MSFADLGVSRPVAGALAKRGITAPFAVQKLVIEDVLDGRDVLVQSPTGSGKTLAFGVPLVDLIEADDRRPAALILAPTRELALQIVDELHDIATARALSVAPVYGGVGLEKQAKRAARAHIVVATPGRLEDLLQRRAFTPRPRPRRWSSTRPTGCSTWASSPPSTGSSPRPRATARRCSSRRRSRPRPARSPAPTRATPAATSTSPSARIAARSSTASSTSSTPTRSARWSTSCATASAAARWSSSAPSAAPTGWSSASGSSGVQAVAMHGNKSQGQRQRALASFASGKIDTLVATDVAARGIDVEEITHVINFDAPGDRDAYVHRVGRSGRAGRDGAGISFVMPDQDAEMRRIAASLGLASEFDREPPGAQPRRRARTSARMAAEVAMASAAVAVGGVRVPEAAGRRRRRSALARSAAARAPRPGSGARSGPGIRRTGARPRPRASRSARARWASPRALGPAGARCRSARSSPGCALRL